MRWCMVWVGLVGCARPPVTVAPDTTFTLAPGESARVRGDGLVLTFVRVVRDDRCPLGVFCIQFGDAELAIRARRERHDTLLILSTADTAAPATIGRYQVAIDVLAPIRRPETTIADTAYRATLLVTRAGAP